MAMIEASTLTMFDLSYKQYDVHGISALVGVPIQ